MTVVGSRAVRAGMECTDQARCPALWGQYHRAAPSVVDTAFPAWWLCSLLDVVSFGGLSRLSCVVMVERLVPDKLRELFQRVVPPTQARPQGGGRCRYGDREVPAAIVFMATTGCTWRQLLPIFGP